jgi:hypothetical protein
MKYARAKCNKEGTHHIQSIVSDLTRKENSIDMLLELMLRNSHIWFHAMITYIKIKRFVYRCRTTTQGCQ